METVNVQGLTETVIVDAVTEIVAVKDTEAVIVDNASGTIIVSGIMGPPGTSGATAINQLLDVDVSNLTNGAVLVYSTQTNKWTAGINLENQIIEAGQF